MRILHFDAFSGISGDMTVGALLDLGADLEHLRSRLALLPVHGYALRASEVLVTGIRAIKFDVEIEGEVTGDELRVTGEGPEPHAHAPEHGAHAHAESPPVTRHPSPVTSPHHRRSYRDIRAMLETSGLTGGEKEKALAIFARLAEAEAKVHGTTPDEVHFHEVGAIDSIVDVAGTAIALTQLGVERITVSALPLGSGFVRSQHGVIPVPGPATIELLTGFPVRPGKGNGEMVTPTGAAILAALAVPAEPAPPMVVERIGYGAGTKRFADRPNLLRALLGRPAVPLGRDQMALIETNIDDANPELFDWVMERLFAAGARDVWFTPIQMKKNRPATLLSVLCEPAARDALAAIVLAETTAIGVRFATVERLTLPREMAQVETEYGPVAVKIATAPDGARRATPEYESCRAIARARGVPLKIVYDAASRGAATKK